MLITRRGWKFPPQRPEVGAVCRSPDVIAGETDMLSPERADVFDHVGRRGDAFPDELGEGRFEIEGVPADNGIDKKVQPRRPIELALEGPVPQFSETVEEERAGQCALGFSLVEAGSCVPAHFGVLPPLEQENGPIDTPKIS